MVHYTRSQLEGYLSRNIPKDVVDRIMQDITLFEFGDKRVHKLNDTDGLFRLRVGDYRVIFQQTHGNNLILTNAGDRKEIYD